MADNSKGEFLLELPPVAKSVFTYCKKCEADRYHRVLAHVDSKSAKVECEICKAKKKFTLPKAQDRSSTARAAKGAAKIPRTKAATGEAKKNQHAEEYSLLLNSLGKNDGLNYTMKTQFTVNQKLEHPKFGIGFVKAVLPEKIEVVFSDEIRSLVHNRQ